MRLSGGGDRSMRHRHGNNSNGEGGKTAGAHASGSAMVVAVMFSAVQVAIAGKVGRVGVFESCEGVGQRFHLAALLCAIRTPLVTSPTAAPQLVASPTGSEDTAQPRAASGVRATAPHALVHTQARVQGDR